MVSIRTPSSVETFTVQKGDVFFIPKGFIHHIANIGELRKPHRLRLQSCETRNYVTLHAISSLNEEVFTATFKTPPKFVEGLKKSKKHDLIASIPSMKKGPANISSRFKFNIGDSSKPVLTKGGYLQLATKANLSVLDGLGIWDLDSTQKESSNRTGILTLASLSTL